MYEDKGLFTQLFELISTENATLVKVFIEKFLKAYELIDQSSLQEYLYMLLSIVTPDLQPSI